MGLACIEKLKESAEFLLFGFHLGFLSWVCKFGWTCVLLKVFILV